METKIVYVLVSDYGDYYYEQLLISLYTLRQFNTDVFVELVVDEATKDSFAGNKGNRLLVEKYINKFNVISVPETYDSKKKRSRYLKTHLRNLVTGDYLFVDTDTVICARLPLSSLSGEKIRMVYDRHNSIPLSQNDTWIWNNAKTVGVDISGLPHFNSGIAFVPDTLDAYRLYEKWSCLYEEFSAKGVSIDQLPLCVANKDCGYVISEMADVWNCQIKSVNSEVFLKDALIIHFYASCEDYKWYHLFNETLFLQIKLLGDLPAEIKCLSNDPLQVCMSPNLFIEGSILCEQMYRFLYAHDNYPKFFNFLCSLCDFFRMAVTKLFLLKKRMRK